MPEDIFLNKTHGTKFVSDRRVSFSVWAPNVKGVSLELALSNGPKSILEMAGTEKNYFSLTCDASDHDEYSFLLNGKIRRPDPASRYQPSGVHGPSSVVNPESYRWHDQFWKGISQNELIIYELHVGTFSKKGTFESIIPYLDQIEELGITAIEIMPVAQFPGERNWGYDGVDLFAPQNSYGGPSGLKKLVDSCHRRQLSIILDVVYNHLGPEGNYLGDFGPYFSSRYRTPWGPAVNYDESGSDEVRKFVLQNACYWIQEYHIDGLRIDAVDKILDFSPMNILLEIEEYVHRVADILGKQVHVIGESDLNDPRIISPKETGGYSIDAQWSDDFHHSVHSFLTGERFGYYADFGDLNDIAKSLSSSFVYDGKFSTYRGKTHGAPATGLNGEKFVFCLQNHDQVGNHPDGKRLSSLLTFNQLKVAVAILIFSQSLPMIFMGEEYADTAPFRYFVDHSGRDLIKAVRVGRMKEHKHFALEQEFMDPQSESTFFHSKLNHSLKFKGLHKKISEYYRDVIRLRNSLPPFRSFQRESQEISLLEKDDIIIMDRIHGESTAKCIFVLGDSSVTIGNPADDGYRLVFDSTKYTEKSKSKISRVAKETRFNEELHLEAYSATVFAKLEPTQ